MPSPEADNNFEDDQEFNGVNTLKTWREVPPTHYMLKIESFSSLVRILDNTGQDYYESNEFDASGYNWKLLLYPKGDWNKNGSGHISLYLKICNLGGRRSIDALLTFFIYDQLKDKYLSIQDISVRKFDSDQKEWGLSQLVSLNCFRNASNGYLINDSCVFGVEVFVISKGEKACFRTLRKQREKVYIWNVEKFSELKKTGHFSQPFSVGGYNWKLHLYPKGIPKEKDRYMSIYLCLQDEAELPRGFKMHVEFKLRLIDEVDEKNKHYSKRGNAWFTALETAWGFPRFISSADLRKRLSSRSLSNRDALQIELQIISISMASGIIFPKIPKNAESVGEPEEEDDLPPLNNSIVNNMI